MKEMVYKLDFLLGLVTTFVYMAVQILLIKLFFTASGLDNIAGYTEAEFLFVFYMIQIMMGFQFVFVYPSLDLAANQIFTGNLDFILIKPINTVFVTSMQKVSMTVGLIIVVYLLFFFSVIKQVFSVFEIARFMQLLYVLILSNILFFCMIWISSLLWFIWPRFKSLRWFIHNTQDITRYPREFYPKILQNMLVYLIPMFLIINPVFMIIKNTYTWGDFWLMISMTTIVVMIYLLLWRDGLRRYSSAA